MGAMITREHYLDHLTVALWRRCLGPSRVNWAEVERLVEARSLGPAVTAAVRSLPAKEVRRMVDKAVRRRMKRFPMPPRGVQP